MCVNLLIECWVFNRLRAKINRNMVGLLAILGTIFLIVSVIFWSKEAEMNIRDVIVASVATILMTLCYVGSVFAQYMIEFMK